MEKSVSIAEPVVERWDSVVPQSESEESEAALEIFSLSGGVMSKSQTANRIDGLLSKMLESPGSCRYVGNIDKNLDYLFTHLQLDMIERVARDAAAREEIQLREMPKPEPVLALDRVRASV